MSDFILLGICVVIAICLGFVIGHYVSGDLKIIYKGIIYGIERCATPYN